MFKYEINLLKERMSVFAAELKRLTVKNQTDLKLSFFNTKEHLDFQNACQKSFSSIKEGEKWGSAWENAWFKIEGSIPSDYTNTHLQLDFTGEILLFNKNGSPIRGLTSGSVFTSVYDVASTLHPISDKGNILYYAESSSNNLFGVARNEYLPKSDIKRYALYDSTVKIAKICDIDKGVEALFYDVQVLRSIYNCLSDNPQKNKILNALSKSADVFRGDRNNAQKARQILKPFINAGNRPSDLTAISIGHAHIDTAWLWPVSQTRKKCLRTFSTQLHLLENYKDYIFGASQPQLYQYVKENSPEIYQKIKQAHKEGRWELQGAMWVESDTNLPSGESLVRQVLLGKNFYLDEFGEDIKNLWLPDVFGYSAALPQILKKSGVDYFMTQKLSWNETNKLPSMTFVWEGIDGSGVKTHFLPENTYNGSMDPSDMHKAQNNFLENHFMDEFLVLFGIGDGGGGPKEDQIERALRMQSTESTPKVKFQKAQKFLETLDNYDLKKWVGELYFELHRGTYTTQALVKKMNRKLEYLFVNIEKLYAHNLTDYPYEKLDSMWKLLLMNQFHDVIPGSSIKEVYEQTHKEHAFLLKESQLLLENFKQSNLKSDQNSVMVFNQHNFSVKTNLHLSKDFQGYEIKCEDKLLESQDLDDGVLVYVQIPPLSFVNLKRTEKKSQVQKEDNDLILENDFVKYNFSKEGLLTSAFLKSEEEELLKTPSNLFSLYEDKPYNWEAWDVSYYYEKVLLETAKLTEIKKVKRGTLEDSLEFEFSISNSKIHQKVYLQKNSSTLFFDTKVDWDEVRKMLRVGFDTNIKTDKYTADIQFGHLSRNTHRNTSWDFTKFEAPAHKYIDLSDNIKGVSLINDCKYGYKVLGGFMDLNLLRSTQSPDVDADIGSHQFLYALHPHSKEHSAQITRHALLINNPPVVIENASSSFDSLVSISNEDIFVESIKKSEKEDCLILRLVEMAGHYQKKVEVKSAKNAVLTDLMERLESKNLKKEFALNFTPFEIKTIKLK